MALIYFKKKYFMFDGVHFLTETGSYTKSQDTELRYPSESDDPYRIDMKERSVEVSLEGVPLEFEGTDIKKLFDNAYNTQSRKSYDLPNLEMYDYEKDTGEMTIHDVFENCVITKIEYKGDDDLMDIDLDALAIQKKI
jgi:hypothetical protein